MSDGRNPHQVLSMMRTQSVEIDLTAKMIDRLLMAAAIEGMTRESFIESALVEKISKTEKNHRRHPGYRGIEEFPEVCPYCTERFRLPMHMGRHISHTHPEKMTAEVEKLERGIEESLIEPTPEPDEPQEPEFKLAAGITPEMMAQFDEGLEAPEPPFPAGDVPSL